MSHSIQEVERRLHQVEKDLAELKAALGAEETKPWYRQIVGDFAQDPAFAQIVRLGRLARQSQQ